MNKRLQILICMLFTMPVMAMADETKSEECCVPSMNPSLEVLSQKKLEEIDKVAKITSKEAEAKFQQTVFSTLIALKKSMTDPKELPKIFSNPETLKKLEADPNYPVFKKIMGMTFSPDGVITFTGDATNAKADIHIPLGKNDFFKLEMTCLKVVKKTGWIIGGMTTTTSECKIEKVDINLK